MIYKHAIITLMARVFSIVTGFVASILTARYLGPTGRGDYFFVTTLALLLTQFAHLGLASSNTYLVAQHPNLLRPLMINSFWVSLIIGLVVSGIALATINMTHTCFPAGTWALLILVPTSIFYLLGTNLLVGINKLAMFNAYQIGSCGLLVCLILFMGLAGGQVYGFLMASSLGWLLVVICLFWSLLRLSKSLQGNFSFDKRCFLQGAGYGVKAYLVTLLGMFVLKGNVVLLKTLSNGAELGYYSIASQLNDCLAILPASIGLVLFPNLVRNTSHRWQEMKKNLWVIIVFMLLVCLLAALLAKSFIVIAFGARYLPAVAVFWRMLPGAFFFGMITIISQYIAAIGMPGELIAAWLVAFIIMMGGSWVLIPLYAGQGAAISLSLAYFILFGMILFLAKKRHRGIN